MFPPGQFAVLEVAVEVCVDGEGVEDGAGAEVRWISIQIFPTGTTSTRPGVGGKLEQRRHRGAEAGEEAGVREVVAAAGGDGPRLRWSTMTIATKMRIILV